MPVVAKLVAEIDADISKLKRGVADAEARLNQLQNTAVQAGNKGQSSLAAWGSKAVAFGGKMKDVGQSMTVGVTLPLIALGKKAVDSAVELDSLDRGLAAVMGSSQAAAKEFIRLREVAKLPGLGLAEAMQGSIRLQSVGLSAEEAAKGMKAFGNAIALVGGGKQQLATVTYQLGQMFGAGKLQGDELRIISDAVPQLRLAMKDLFGTMDPKELNKKYKVEEIFAGMVTALEKLPQVTAGPKIALENIADDMEIVFSRIGKAIIPLITKVTDLLVPKILELTQSFSELPEPVQTAIVAFTALVAGLGPLLMIGGSLVTVIGAIGSAIAAIGWPITIIVAAIAALGTAFATNFMGIRDAVMPVVDALKAGFEFIREKAVEVFQRVWPDVVSTFSEIAKDFQPLLNDIRNWFKETFGEITKWVQENWPLIQQTISKVMDLIVKGIKVGLAAIRKFWDDHGEGIMNIVRAAWDFIKNVVMARIEMILGFVKAAMQAFNGDWEGAWTTLKETASKMVARIIDAAKALWEGIKNVFNELFKIITNFQQRLFLAAAKLGMAIVNGIINGVKGLAAKAAQTVANMAHDILNTAKSVLGIRSPSREFEEIGRDLVMGLALGITAAGPGVFGVISKLMTRTISKANEEMDQYLDRIKILKDALGADTVSLKTALSVTDENRTALQLLGVEYEELSKDQQKLVDEIVGVRKAYQDLTQVVEEEEPEKYAAGKHWMQVLGETLVQALKRSQEEYKKLQDAINQKMAQELQAINDEIKKAKGEWTKVDEVLKNLALDFNTLTEAQRDMVQAIVQASQELEAWQKYREEMEEYERAIENAAWMISDVLVDAFEQSYEKGFKTFFGNVIAGFQKLLLRLAMEYLQSQLVRLLMNTLGGGGGILGGIFGIPGKPQAPTGGLSMIFDNVAAQGGTVLPNQLTLVGERGPELIMPDVRSRVIPNHELNRMALAPGYEGGSSEGGSRGASIEKSVVVNFSPTYIIQSNNPEDFRYSQRQTLADAERQIGEMSRRLN